MAFRRPDGTYTLEVQINKLRYTQETGITCSERASKAQKKWKEELKAELKAREIADARTRDAKGKVRDMPFIDLVAIYWTQKGRYAADEMDRKRNLKRLTEWIGPDTMVSEIDDPMVNKLIERRREDYDSRIRVKEPKVSKLRKDGTLRKNATKIRLPKLPRKVSCAEVNRSVTQLLRTVMFYGRNEMKLLLPDMPNWKTKMLPEEDREREMSHDEEIALGESMREDYLVAYDFATFTGLRRKTVVALEWGQINFDLRTLKVKGKGNKWHTVAITPAIEFILRAQEGKHLTRVFTFEAQRTVVRNPKNGQAYRKGERYALNYQTFGTVWRRTCEKAGIENLHIHDLRHTYASRLLRETKDLRIVQKALAHSSISVTERYVHVLQEDLARYQTEMEIRNADIIARKKSHKSSTATPEAA
jgi:integrase